MVSEHQLSQVHSKRKDRPKTVSLMFVEQLTSPRNKLVGRSTIRIAGISIVGPTIGVIVASVPSIVDALGLIGQLLDYMADGQALPKPEKEKNRSGYKPFDDIARDNDWIAY